MLPGQGDRGTNGARHGRHPARARHRCRGRRVGAPDGRGAVEAQRARGRHRVAPSRRAGRGRGRGRRSRAGPGARRRRADGVDGARTRSRGRRTRRRRRPRTRRSRREAVDDLLRTLADRRGGRGDVEDIRMSELPVESIPLESVHGRARSSRRRRPRRHHRRHRPPPAPPAPPPPPRTPPPVSGLPPPAAAARDRDGAPGRGADRRRAARWYRRPRRSTRGCSIRGPTPRRPTQRPATTTRSSSPPPRRRTRSSRTRW